MARYDLAFTHSGITAAGGIADILSSATDRLRILEVGLAVSAMSGTNPVLTYGLFRTTAIGTRTSPVTVLPLDNAEAAGTASVATAWSVAATLAANPLRRFVASAVGAGIVWPFPPNTFMVANSLSVMLQAITVAGTTPNFTIDGYFAIDE